MRIAGVLRTSIRARLIVGVGLMMLPVVAMGAGAIYSHQNATNALAETTTEIVREIEPVSNLQLAVDQAAMPPNYYIILGDGGERANFARLSRRADKAFQVVLASPFARRGERLRVLAALRQWRKVKRDSLEILAMPRPRENPAAVEKMKQLDADTDHIVSLLDQVHAISHLEIVQRLAEVDALKQRAFSIVIFVFAASLVFTVGIGTALAGSILKPLSVLTESARRFAAGDLGHRAPKMSNDELGQFSQAFNTMAEKLESNVIDIQGSESRFRAISETATDAIISIDANRRIVFANRAAEECFGYATNELIGQDVAVLMPERFLKNHARGVKNYLATGRASGITRETEFAGLKKDGTEFPIEMSVAAWTSGSQTFFTSIIRDITERKNAEQLLKQMSITDSLTGLFNHAEFYQRLKEELERSRRYGSPVSLLMLDIDHFKEINDSYGHQAGDTVLLALADIVVKAVRPIDKVARYGGEEFTIILPETNNAGALATAERLRRRVEERTIRVDNARTARITVSIGVAECPLDAATEDALVSRADEAMYASKAAGRNRVQALKKAA